MPHSPTGVVVCLHWIPVPCPELALGYRPVDPSPLGLVGQWATLSEACWSFGARMSMLAATLMLLVVM